MADPLPGEVTKLIREHIVSVDQLEVLLLAHRDPAREWTAAEVADELRTNPVMASTTLTDLSYRGFLTMTDPQRQAYAYRAVGNNARAVDMLASTYPTFRHRIIELIFTSRRSDDALANFADAFRIKKD